MLKVLKISAIYVCLLSLIACSKSAENIANQLPPPPANNEEQEVPSNVPAIPEDAVYFGAKALITDAVQEFSINTKPMHGVADFELIATEDIRYYFDLFKTYTSYQGTCSQSNSKMEWLEIDGDGNILNQQDLNFFSHFDAENGKRYILRIHFMDLQDCDTVISSVKVVEQ